MSKLSFTGAAYAGAMNSDLATSLMMARSAATQFSAQVAVVRKNHEMDMALIQMVDEAARAAPPPGQGKVVDKTA